MFIPANIMADGKTVKWRSVNGNEIYIPSAPLVFKKLSKAKEKKANCAGHEILIQATQEPEAPHPAVGADEVPSQELQFLRTLDADPGFAIGGKVESGYDNTIYRWTETEEGAAYWDALRQEELEALAMDWLSIRAPHRFSKKCAISLIDSARASMVLNPDKALAHSNSVDVVIGVYGAYLHVSPTTGVITPKRPDRSVGLTYSIPANFD